MKRTISLLLLLALLLPCLTACGDAAYAKYSTYFFDTFDTMVTIIGYAWDRETFDRVAAEARAEFQRLHKLYDGYHSYPNLNNLYTINEKAAEAPVPVDEDLMALLLYCKEVQPQFGGLVNVAMGSVLRIWHAYREAGEGDPENAELPPMDALLAASAHTNFDDVILDEAACTIYFADPALTLDLGAVAKGFATERVARMMLKSDMPSFILSAGGNVRVGEPPRDGRLRWGVSIQDPDGLAFTDAETDILDVLFLHSASVVTSGDYQRFYTVDGARYHHIISPETLMPATHLRAVTVVAEDSGFADILSTALFLMPYEEGRAFVDAIDGAEALWVLPGGAIEMTNGMAAMARSRGASSK